ncbi:hypothetical protein KY285_006413 [Solanum tuberosum]|nr:hypothetical protein KY285_031038 [Solanum tuberosum]KAH0753265.1 hypothetical protein KY285_006413 [Solanum tuberosum]
MRVEKRERLRLRLRLRVEMRERSKGFLERPLLASRLLPSIVAARSSSPSAVALGSYLVDSFV